MEHELNELAQIHSPRNIVELTHQLIGTQSTNGQHFQFQEDQNPFSFYNQDNKRQSSQSEQEPENSQKRHQRPRPSPPQQPQSEKLPSVPVGDNLAQTAPFKLQSPSEKQQPMSQQSNKAVMGQQSPIKLSSFKESPFDFQKFSKTPEPNKNAAQIMSAERKYQQDLQNDLSQLKNSFKGQKKSSKVFDAKKSQKVNVNKTFVAPRLKNTESKQMEAEQMRMLIKMAFQKKKANYQMLKAWDRNRAEKMALNCKLLDQLLNEVDIRIKASLQNFQLYQTFFREKVHQQQKYISSPVINTRYALQNNSLSKNVYINCSVILNSLYDENVARCKRITDFIYLIHQNILKQLTEKHLESSQRDLLKVRQKISTLKSSLKKYNQQTQEKGDQLAVLFNDQANHITNQNERDFYRTQLSFLRKAFMQIQVQKKLGEYCLQYYQTAINQQIKRSKVIHQAMITYSQGLKQAYGVGVDATELQQMSKNQELNLINEFYSLEQMFDQRTLELFKAKNGIKEELTFQLFNDYISKFHYDPFDSRIILLKEFTVRYVTVSKGKEIKEQSCYLVITVDNFLHMSFNCQRNLYNKPDMTIKINGKLLQIKSLKQQMLQISKKEERRYSMMSYFWDNKVQKTYRIKFSKKDNKEEFMDYIKKLMVELA